MFNLIIFGPPGTGKGTQSRRLRDKYGLVHISSGDLMRREIISDSSCGAYIKNYVDKGLLVPDRILIQKVSEELLKQETKVGYIFDGFPRTLVQARFIDRFFKFEGIIISMVLSIEVEKTELLYRLKARAVDSGRSDDKEDIMRHRLRVYEQQTHSLLKYYSKQNKLFCVDGMAETEVVFGRICKIIDPRI